MGNKSINQWFEMRCGRICILCGLEYVLCIVSLCMMDTYVYLCIGIYEFTLSPAPHVFYVFPVADRTSAKSAICLWGSEGGFRYAGNGMA